MNPNELEREKLQNVIYLNVLFIASKLKVEYDWAVRTGCLHKQGICNSVFQEIFQPLKSRAT